MLLPVSVSHLIRPITTVLTLIHPRFQRLRVGRQLCPLLTVFSRYKPCGP